MNRTPDPDELLSAIAADHGKAQSASTVYAISARTGLGVPYVAGALSPLVDAGWVVRSGGGWTLTEDGVERLVYALDRGFDAAMRSPQEEIEFQRQALVASWNAEHDLLAARDALVAAFEESAGGPTAEELIDEILAILEQAPDLAEEVIERLAPAADLDAEFQAMVASVEAEYPAFAAPLYHGRGVLVASYVSPPLPDDPTALLAALAQRDMEPGGIVAAVRARERVGTPAPAPAPRRAQQARRASLADSTGPTAGHSADTWRRFEEARAADRLLRASGHAAEALTAPVARGGARGKGSRQRPRATGTITAAAAWSDAPDGSVITFPGYGRDARRSRLADLLGART